MNEEEQKYARLMELYEGNPSAAMSLYVCLADGINGYEKDLDLAYKYLVQAAQLGEPKALDYMRRLCIGEDVNGIKGRENIELAVKYAHMLAYIDEIVDFSKFSFYQGKQDYIERYKLEGKAWLGWMYICNEWLNNSHLGFIITLDMAENYHLPISLYALGWWYFKAAPVHDFEEALVWLRRCGTNDSGYWGRSSAELYNEIAEDMNRWRDGNNQIPYFDI